MEIFSKAEQTKTANRLTAAAAHTHTHTESGRERDGMLNESRAGRHMDMDMDIVCLPTPCSVLLWPTIIAVAYFQRPLVACPMLPATCAAFLGKRFAIAPHSIIKIDFTSV